jgi:hypothetical protein
MRWIEMDYPLAFDACDGRTSQTPFKTMRQPQWKHQKVSCIAILPQALFEGQTKQAPVGHDEDTCQDWAFFVNALHFAVLLVVVVPLNIINNHVHIQSHFLSS